MKPILITVFLLFSFASFADCPSMDEALKANKRGEITQIDLLEVVSCNISICDFQLIYLKNKLSYTTNLFNIGEKTKIDIADVALEYSQKQSECEIK